MIPNYLKLKSAVVTEGERRFLKELAEGIAQKFSSPMIVNIGIMWGCTMWCLRTGAPKADMVGVDIRPQHWKIYSPKLLNARIIKGNSNEVWRDFDEPIHLLFTDGGHDYPTVRADIKGWAPKVVKGGILAFHDYKPLAGHLKSAPSIDGVRRAVNEWVGGHRPGTLKRVGARNSIIAYRKI